MIFDDGERSSWYVTSFSTNSLQVPFAFLEFIYLFIRIRISWMEKNRKLNGKGRIIGDPRVVVSGGCCYGRLRHFVI